MHNVIKRNNALFFFLFLTSTWTKPLMAKDILTATTSYPKLNIHELPKLIQQPAGYEVKLRCGIYGRDADFMDQSSAIWDFKRCSGNYKQTACRSSAIDDDGGAAKDDWQQQQPQWTNIRCDIGPCKATLVIPNPTERDSGLYRCSIQPYRPNAETTLHIQVVRTYQLDVINYTIDAPELLDDLPTNTTALIGAQVVLQCRIHSKVLPTIKWFRKQDTTSIAMQNEDDTNELEASSRVVHFYENTYQHLESADARGPSENTYLSKLIFNRVTEHDGGLYVCVGINYRGYKWREAYLNVVDDDDDDDQHLMDSSGQIMDKSFGTRELLLLFLIPVGLAMVPLSMWTCYVIFRKRKPAVAKATTHRKYSVVCENDVYV